VRVSPMFVKEQETPSFFIPRRVNEPSETYEREGACRSSSDEVRTCSPTRKGDKKGRTKCVTVVLVFKPASWGSAQPILQVKGGFMIFENSETFKLYYINFFKRLIGTKSTVPAVHPL
jgi:hypothetical protein